MASAKAKLQDYGLLAAFVAVAYWPLSTLHHITKWDSIETYFPFRYFLSDCIQNGIFPLWNPYQMGGYPFYGDPQSGVWYPLAWLSGSLAPYSFAVFTLEYLVTLLIAATGMYELARSFHSHRSAALIAGVSYCACGFFVSNAEHLSWIVSAAWTPWIFWAYSRMIQTGKTGYALLTGLTLFLLLSGGYPAFFIVAAYLLFLFFVITLVRRHHNLWQNIRLHVIIGASLFLLSAGLLLSIYQSLPLSTRGGGVSLAQANIYPFSPHCLTSLLLPFASLKDDAFFATDIAMRNGYLGLIAMTALPFAFADIRHRRLLMLIAGLTLICLLISFGEHTLLRALLYRFVPLMDTFRFPAMFRLYFIIGLILLAAHGITAISVDIRRHRQRVLQIGALLIAIYAAILLTSIILHGWNWPWGILGSSFEAYQERSSRIENQQLQSIVQMILLSILLLAGLVRRGKYFGLRLLFAFCCADMAVATSMNAFTTIVAPERAPNIERPLLTAPHNFPVPDNSKPVSAWRDEYRGLPGLSANTGVYFKTPAAGGYNSFVLKGHNRMQYSAILDSVEANPYLYFSSGTSVGADELPLSRKDEVRLERDSANASQRSLWSLYSRSDGDTIQVLEFLPNRIVANVRTQRLALLNLQQNYVPGWKVFLDGKEAAVIITNFKQMGILVPEGSHQLRWTFNPPYIRMAMIFAPICLLIFVAGMIVFRRRLFVTTSRD